VPALRLDAEAGEGVSAVEPNDEYAFEAYFRVRLDRDHGLGGDISAWATARAVTIKFVDDGGPFAGMKSSVSFEGVGELIIDFRQRFRPDTDSAIPFLY